MRKHRRRNPIIAPIVHNDTDPDYVTQLKKTAATMLLYNAEDRPDIHHVKVAVDEVAREYILTPIL